MAADASVQIGSQGRMSLQSPKLSYVYKFLNMCKQVQLCIMTDAGVGQRGNAKPVRAAELVGGGLNKAGAEAQHNLVLVHELVEVLARGLGNLHPQHPSANSQQCMEQICALYFSNMCCIHTTPQSLS